MPPRRDSSAAILVRCMENIDIEFIRVARLGFTTTYKTAGTAKIRGSRTRHRMLWVGKSPCVLWQSTFSFPGTSFIRRDHPETAVWKTAIPRLKRRVLPKSDRTTSDDSQVGTETQALDADLQRNAPAIEKVFEKRFQTSSPLYALVHLLNLAMREFLPARPHRGVIP